MYGPHHQGMLRSAVVGAFYLDLQNPDFVSQFCIYHRRFSTNTVPKWPLAQPMRFLGHNGEINTLQGNLNWMASKEADMTHPVWNGREGELRPVCNPGVSDSANLDRVAELLVQSERPVAETMMLLVPEAYRNHPELDATYPEAGPQGQAGAHTPTPAAPQLDGWLSVLSSSPSSDDARVAIVPATLVRGGGVL